MGAHAPTPVARRWPFDGYRFAGLPMLGRLLWHMTEVCTLTEAEHGRVGQHSGGNAMTKVTSVLLLVLVFVSAPQLGAEEVKIVGRDIPSMPLPCWARA